MIMAGGSGTRLWPLSRRDRPKQLVPFLNRDGRRQSLLEVAAGRLEGLVAPNHRFICTSESYRTAIRTSLPEFRDEQILGEPVGRDTVNAVGLAAVVIHKLDPDAIFCVLTADHLIEPVDQFRKLIEEGFQLVEADQSRLVTFSIQPTHPATGYGYVERSQEIEGSGGRAFRVERFVEKPSFEKAQAYIESGAFAWNSGMFVWSAATLIDCLRRYKPESHAGLMRIAEAWGTDRQVEVLEEVYPTLPKISVDYAVMEPATREQARTAKGGGDGVKVCTVLMDLTWLDVGSWPSFAQTLEPDGDGNRSSGSTIVQGTKDTLVVNVDDRHTIAALGCEDLVIVHTEDATLVMPRERAEELKRLYDDLPDRLR
jgi:mannose-1-phosphate guanylyltransferase